MRPLLPRLTARLPIPLLLCALAAAFPTVHAAGIAAPAQSAAALPPIADFFGNAEFSGAVLSPNGKFLAIRIGARGKGERDRLVVVDLATSLPASVASFIDADIGRFSWANDERLVFAATDRTRGEGDLRFAPGMYGVNRDGTLFRQLASRNGIQIGRNAARLMQPWSTYLLSQKGAQDSEFVYVMHPKFATPTEVEYIDLQRINTLTAHVTTVDRPGNSIGWLLDNKGLPRITVTKDADIDTVYYLDPATGAWRKLLSFNAYTGARQEFWPVGFGPDGTLYVVSRARGDHAALHTYNLATNTLSDQPLLKLEGYDVRASLGGHSTLIMDGSTLLGVRYLSDAVGTVWFDPAMKALQASIDTLLPGTVNLLTPPTGAASPYLLVQAYSDTQPLTTLVYNRDTRKLDMVGSEHGSINPAAMGRQTLVHYKARDGHDIPAWLTLPNGRQTGQHLPLVVLAHDGPYARGGAWAWNAEAQFLASRGYAVLAPEYRGSQGFGWQHFHMGWKQWGLAMQDDLADGARWAVAQGTADAKRICIAGAGYGGYATLMGLAKDTELYRCGIDRAGVTDINLLYNGSWRYTSSLSEGWKEYGMPQLVGDQVRDAAQLKATSPLLLADRIRQPLLLAYGGADTQVPLNHGLAFRDAVKAGNPHVEWVEYQEEGHNLALPRNRIDYWSRVETFLDKNIGAAAQ